jgi:hypothetical protein
MQNIALQITLNGVPQAVANLDELELRLKEARVELNQLSVGSDAFKKLSSEIKTAESTLKNFKKASEGKDIEATLGDIGKLGGAIGASFAAASAAFQLFGKESEETTEALVAAQNALTIALAARSAGEGLVVVRSLASTIATQAQTAATNASTIATRTFYRVLAANPYGAIIAAVGLLVGALILLNKEQSENAKQAEAAAEAQKNYADAVKTAGLGAKLTADQVGFLVNELQNGRISLDEIEASLRKFATGLQNTNFETQEGQQILNRYVTELANLGTTQDQIAAKQTEYSEAVKAGNSGRQRAIREELRELSIAAARYTEAIAQIEADDKKRGEDRQKRLDAAADREKKRIDDLIDANLARLKADTLIAGANSGIIETENELIKILEEKLNLLKSSAAALDETRTFQDDYNDILKASIKENDSYGKTFFEIETAATFFFNQLSKGEISAEQASDGLKKFREQALATSDEVFSEDKQLQLAEYTKKYSDFYEVLEKAQKIEPSEDFENFGKQLEQALLDVALLEGRLDLEFDPFIARTPERKAEARANAQKELDEVQELYVNWFVETNKLSQGFFDANEEKQQKILTGLRELGTQSFEQLKEAGDVIIKTENDFKRGAKTIEELNKQLLKTSELARSGLILANKELLSLKFDIDFTNIEKGKERLLELENEIATERFDIEGKFINDVEFLNQQLSQKIPGFAKLSYEAKLLILREFLEKEVDATEQAEKTKQEKIAETINFIQDTIGQLQAALGAIQQTTTDFFNLQFEQLEKRYKRVQDSIVGDTEEANQKRLEAEKIYNAERARLEKQAAKAQLRISLFQSIANGAQAVTAALTAGPVIGQILAGITAAATIAQIGIIKQQLNAIDSYRKGGKLKPFATGGMVKGPAHEYGGVKYQGGGIELEGNESVINRVSTVRYQDLLNQINLAGGGSPIVNNFDDSRIVEAIATQRREPIRAYVVESDISNKQQIQRRLELLSQI